MQAVTTAFLPPVLHAGETFVLRASQPTEDRLPFGHFAQQHELVEGAIAILARWLDRAQIRSSKRQASASADELIAFASKKKWQRQVMLAAAAMEAQVQADWRRYGVAFDAGYFRLGVQP